MSLAKGKVNDASFWEHRLQMKAGSDFKYALEYRIRILKLKTRLEESHAISECGHEINEGTVQIVSSGLILIAWKGDMVNMHVPHANHF